MDAANLGTPKLYAEHEPESHRTVNADKTVTETELPGFLEVGVEIDGVRVPLARVTAGHFLNAREAAKSSKSSGSKSKATEA